MVMDKTDEETRVMDENTPQDPQVPVVPKQPEQPPNVVRFPQPPPDETPAAAAPKPAEPQVPEQLAQVARGAGMSDEQIRALAQAGTLEQVLQWGSQLVTGVQRQYAQPQPTQPAAPAPQAPTEDKIEFNLSSDIFETEESNAIRAAIEDYFPKAIKKALEPYEAVINGYREAEQRRQAEAARAELDSMFDPKDSAVFGSGPSTQLQPNSEAYQNRLRVAFRMDAERSLALQQGRPAPTTKELYERAVQIEFPALDRRTAGVNATLEQRRGVQVFPPSQVNPSTATETPDEAARRAVREILAE